MKSGIQNTSMWARIQVNVIGFLDNSTCKHLSTKAKNVS